MSSAEGKAYFKVFWLVFYSFLTNQSLLGQEAAPRHFTALTTRDGLSQSSVNCILRDSYGFMWFGTQDGLNRYDGHSFTVYRHDPANPFSISDNQVKCLFEDEQHRIWIGTLGGGLCIYDRNRDAFLRLGDIGIHPNFAVEPAIQSILQDRQGRLWIGTFRSLLLIDRRRMTITQMQADQDDPTTLSSPTIQSIFEDAAGRIWVGTYNGLDLYDPHTAKFTRWLHDDHNPCSISDDHIMAISQGPGGKLCIATDGGGLNVFDPASNLFRAYRSGRPANRQKGKGQDGIGSDNVRTLCPAPDGRIWVGTENGLDLFDPVKEHFEHYRSTLNGEGSLSDNTVLSLCEDITGILWAGTAKGGVNKYDRNLFYFDVYRKTSDPNSLSGDQVTSFTEDANGDIWVGTDGAGLNRWEASSGRFIHYYPQAGSDKGPSGPAILSLLAARDKQGVWIGTYGNGLDRFDLRTHRFKHYHAGPGADELTNPSIYALLEDRNGNLWMGTNGGGLDVLHPDGSITRHRSTGNRDSISNNYIRCLMEDHGGRIWIGTYSGGISVYDPATRKFTVYDNVVHHLGNQVVFSLCEDSKGRIWAGTMGGGLDLFEPASQRFKVYNEAQGLSNNIVNRIIEDTKGFLWLSTNKGISRLNPATGEFRNFGIHNGVQNLEFLVGSGFRDSRGRIFFGGISGFNVFNPGEETHNRIAPQVRLTGFFLFNKPVRPREPGSPLTGDIGQSAEIVLSHDQSDFSIGFAATSYTAPSENKYAYRLDGLDRSWTMVNGEPRASYTNLSPGRYVFRVKAANNDGVWSSQDTMLSIIVRPPFWKTWWAYLLYTIALLALLYIIYRDLRERERLKARIRLEQMTAQKIKELNEIKLSFFTGVSHELRTPLSLITDPLRRLISGEITPDQTRRYSRLMYDNAMRLTRLIDQMLDWRKLESGHLKTHLRPVNIVAMTKSIAGLFDLHAVERQIRFTVVPPGEEIEVQLDTDKYEKIIFNLVSNAFKYTPDGGAITILIRKGLLDARPCVELHVQDTGVGIAPGLKDKVFELFYQVEGTTRFESASTGVGLALARELAELHGGKLEVASEEGKGADFILYLPLAGEPGADSQPAIAPGEYGRPIRVGWPGLVEDAPGELPAAARQLQRTEATPPEENDEEPPLILLVEDNADLREYIRSELGPAYKTEVAADGASGLEKALQIIPDLVISDVMMPGITGLVLCRTLKTDERTSHIPVVLLTARQSDAHQVEGYSAGADVYIPKPFNMEVVIACVNSLLDSRRRMREAYQKVNFDGTPVPREVFDGASLPGEAFDGSPLPREVFDGSPPSEEVRDTMAPPVNALDRNFLVKAAALVDRHLADPLFDVEVLATGLRISRRQLYRKMKALLGATPHDYIVSRRLAMAGQLLLTGEYTVSEIAYKVGFSDAGNFTRSFTRQYGMSPTKYRKEKK
ncbi:MAG: helix-turn-helix domain-containing protein [Bacteroidetes bacterium]|nr:helix-turn-helix domain-containing protein [Bacteroidota bacterium]